MIYRKSLKLSPQSRQKSTVGEITNHMAVDAEKLSLGFNLMPLILVIPTELIVGCFLLYRILGWSLCAGFAVFFIITPIQGKFVGFLSDYEEDKMGRMDTRVRMMSEVLSNIKIVKLYGWEDAFRKKIDGLRGLEIKAEKSIATLRSCFAIFFSSITLLMALATFSVYSTIGGPNFTPGRMTPEVIFVSMGLFGMLNKPLGLVSMIISLSIAVKIGVGRIEVFLLQEEIDTTVVQRYSRQKSQKAIAIEIEDGIFAWEKEDPVVADADTLEVSDAEAERQPLLSGSAANTTTRKPYRPTLCNINLDITFGSLTAVVGRIGQGKSSLLNAIMGEMYKKQGSIKVYGDVAYVPQQAWICNATVKDNILFGKSFDQDLYDQIVTASGL
ncbi:Multidrug resistance-associated protein 1, partial [Linnemannia gamsii]